MSQPSSSSTTPVAPEKSTATPQTTPNTANIKPSRAGATMLVNAKHGDELRVARLENFKLIDLFDELASVKRTKGNIYKAKVVRVEPSLNAAFIKYGAERHGFLPLKDVAPRYLNENPDTQENTETSSQGDIINLKPGQELLVQVDKEERGNKGAALTTFPSLAGSYVVLMPDSPSTGGISRRIAGGDREIIKNKLAQLKVPEGFGVIIRTAGINRDTDELQWDLDSLLEHWQEIVGAYANADAPQLIHADADVVYRAVRDNLSHDVSKIIVDNADIYEQLKQHLAMAKPHLLECLEFHGHAVPLFTHYQIENQIESMYQRVVDLPSGGSIVIDYTEALTAIDVNSSKATKGGDIEETALQTNLEAIDEVARQLRLRDIGGLIVIDTIDMAESSNREKVEQRLQRAISQDRARIQFTNISKLGLLEVSRQRLDSSFSTSHHSPCPHCDGQGIVRSMDAFTASLLRVLESHATNAQAPYMTVQLPIDVAAYLTNEKRSLINRIESEQETHITIIPNPNLRIPQYDLKRTKSPSKQYSYTLIEPANSNMTIEFPQVELSALAPQQPLVKHQPRHPAQQQRRSTPSWDRWLQFLRRLFERCVNQFFKTSSSHGKTGNNTSSRPHHRRRGGNRSGTRTQNQDREGNQGNRRRSPNGERSASRQGHRPTRHPHQRNRNRTTESHPQASSSTQDK